MLDKEILESVRSISNVNNITTLQVTTNKSKYIFRLPYIITKQISDKDVFKYSIGVRDFCKMKHINCRDYFLFKHIDCN